MTRVRVVGLERATKRIRLQVGQAIAKSKFADKLREAVVKETIENGLGPSLQRSTIKRRERLATVNTTGPGYQAGKSNLTFTGQLLRSLRIKFVASRLVFQFTALKSRRPYNLIRGGKGQKTDNTTIFRGQAELYGRSLANLFSRDKFKQSLTQSLKKTIRDFFKS